MHLRIGITTAAAVLVACNDLTGPVPGDGDLRARAELVDARSGGVAGFYFLPPLAPAAAYTGIFDASRAPSVEICALTGGQCGPIVARFSTAGGGSERVRAHVESQNYIVQWKPQADISLTPVYRIRVIDGAELGHADVKVIRKATDAKSLPAGVTGVLLGATLPIKFRIEQATGGPPARLEVHPGTFLLPGAGSSLQLDVRAFDANGNPTSPGTVTWHSTKPGIIAMSASGVANAAASAGSSQVTARAGNLVSPPVLGLASTVAHGAFLVSDANVMTPPAAASNISVAGNAAKVIVAVDPAQPYKPGWQYRFYLAGAVPSVGQVVIGQGEAPIGGRVIDLTPVNGGTQVTLALLSLTELLPGLQVNETLSLAHAPVTVPAAIRASYDVEREPTGKMKFDPRATPTFAFARGLEGVMTRASVLESESEFQLGPFKCAVVTSGLSVAPSVLNPSFHVDPDLSLDLVYTSNGLQKLLVHGSVDAGAGENPVFPVEVEETLECKVELASVSIPISGPMSLFFGGQVPFGVGFEIGAKMSFGNFGVDMAVTAGASMTLGIDCTAGCASVATLSGSATGTLKPSIPDFTTSARSELSAGAFVWAGFAVGNPVIEALQFDAFEAKAGLTQSFELATPVAQASDATYASSFTLSFDVEAGTANDLEDLAELLSIELPPLKFENSSTLASSPKVQAFTISPASVQAAGSSSAGEEASFILTLDPVLFMGAYAVDSIELFRKKPGIGGAFTLETVPGQCGRIAPSSGQSAFTCASTLPEGWAGDQTIYAFVKARLFGVSLPVLLEAGPDATATINVRNAALSLTPGSASLTPGATQQFQATVTGLSNTAVTWTATGGSVSATGLYTAGSSPGTFEVKATSAGDASIVATATIDISACTGVACGTPTSITVAPNPAFVTPGRTVQMTALVNGAIGTGVTWSTTGGGTIDAGGLYTAGADEGTWYIDATSVLNPSITARVALHVVVPVWTSARSCSGNAATIVQALYNVAQQETHNEIDGTVTGFDPFSGSASASDQASGGGGTATASAAASASSSVVGNATTLALESGSMSAGGSGTAGASPPTGDPFYRPVATGGGAASCSVTFWVQRNGVSITLTGSLSASNDGVAGYSLLPSSGTGESDQTESGTTTVNRTIQLVAGRSYRLSINGGGGASAGGVTSPPPGSGSASLSFSFQTP